MKKTEVFYIIVLHKTINMPIGDILFFSLFSFIFIIAAFILFYCSKKSWRYIVALLISVIFCFYYSKSAGVVLILESIFIYIYGLIIHNLKEKNKDRYCKIFSFIVIVALVSQIIFFKEVDSVVMPIGLSFYTFQMIGYIVDVSKGRINAEKNPLIVALSFFWFPKLMSGPVEKVKGLSEQFRQIDKFSPLKNEVLYNGFIYILYGFFAKLVIADKIAPIVDVIFNAPENFGSFWLIVGSLLYTFQIYFDFAGYSYIAIGVSSWFGVNLMQNFKTPYFSENITDFWRRWHISLSGWLKEYIYFSLGGNQKGISRKYINLIIVFIICGFWHGKGFSFIAWGLLHGLYSVGADIAGRKNVKPLVSGWSGRVITFILVSFAWIFFRANSFRGALFYIKRMFFSWDGREDIIAQKIYALNIENNTLIFVALVIVFLFIIDYLSYKNEITPPEFIVKCGEITRGFIICGMILLLFVFGVYGSNLSSTFIYMQF